MHQEQPWLHLFALPAFHRDLACPRYDEPRMTRRRMHVDFLGLAGSQRDYHRAKLVADVHPARTKLFGTNDNVIGDPKDALSRVCLWPISVASGDDLHIHPGVPFRLAHVPEKWEPVFRRGHAPINESRTHPDSTQSGCALGDEPIAGVRLYSYYDDGVRNTVGRLDCARYVVLADPATARPIAILDEHWTYAIRSAAAAMVALKWLGPRAPRTLGLVGVGTMGENCLRCLRHLYKFDEIICTSRREETREAFAAKWSKLLGIPVRPLATVEEVVRNADLAIGCTTRTDIVSREPWVRRGATFVSLARREMDPAGWTRFDKTVIDDWDCNMTVREFRDMIEAGELTRE